jgi:hypothetical protein
MSKETKLATLTKSESAVYSNEFAHYMNNTRQDTARADRYAWRETVKSSPRLAKFQGGRP